MLLEHLKQANPEVRGIEVSSKIYHLKVLKDWNSTVARRMSHLCSLYAVKMQLT